MTTHLVSGKVAEGNPTSAALPLAGRGGIVILDRPSLGGPQCAWKIHAQVALELPLLVAGERDRLRAGRSTAGRFEQQRSNQSIGLYRAPVER